VLKRDTVSSHRQSEIGKQMLDKRCEYNKKGYNKTTQKAAYISSCLSKFNNNGRGDGYITFTLERRHCLSRKDKYKTRQERDEE